MNSLFCRMLKITCLYKRKHGENIDNLINEFSIFLLFLFVSDRVDSVCMFRLQEPWYYWRFSIILNLWGKTRAFWLTVFRLVSNSSLIDFPCDTILWYTTLWYPVKRTYIWAVLVFILKLHLNQYFYPLKSRLCLHFFLIFY